MQVFLDHATYTGPRWTYALLLRPISVFNLPYEYRDQMILGSQRTHPQYRHGTIDYAVELPAELVEHFDLQLTEYRA